MKLPEYTCACLDCKMMCHRTPCLGTPEEMMAIQKAGFGDKLIVVKVYDSFMLSPDSEDAQFKFNYLPVKGRCTFLTDRGQCRLHDLGLKPIEGRNAIHDGGEHPGDVVNLDMTSTVLRRALSRSWDRPIGRALVKQFDREYNLGQFR